MEKYSTVQLSANNLGMSLIIKNNVTQKKHKDNYEHKNGIIQQ